MCESWNVKTTGVLHMKIPITEITTFHFRISYIYYYIHTIFVIIMKIIYQFLLCWHGLHTELSQIHSPLCRCMYHHPPHSHLSEKRNNDSSTSHVSYSSMEQILLEVIPWLLIKNLHFMKITVNCIMCKLQKFIKYLTDMWWQYMIN